MPHKYSYGDKQYSMKPKWNLGVRISAEASGVFNGALSVTETEGSCGCICPYLFCEGILFKFQLEFA